MHQTVARHKTAISRTALSRPIKLALADGILKPELSVLDYGCGLGDDLRILTALGFEGAGWDPVHRPGETLQPSPIVNIGYVVNVIEDPGERQCALRTAWDLAEQVLIVSARLGMDSRHPTTARELGDGCLTSRNTFQKFFDQLELRNWIDQTLSVSCVPAAPGVFYVFRTEQGCASYIASRYRRRLSKPRLSKSAVLFQEHEGLLTPLLEFVGERGRLPGDDELPNVGKLRDVFGSIPRAIRVVKHATDTTQWDEVAEQRTLDLLIYIGLSRFEGRPKYSRLPRALQRDVKAFFSHYKRACEQADEMLLSLGEPGNVEIACQLSKIGKLTPTALYVHESALDRLSPLLRLFEGCARNYIGRVDGTTLIKLDRKEPKVSYLGYPDFETDPHPALSFSLTVHFQTFRVKRRDYSKYRNPPILHRKETFLAQDHPLHQKFARLTRIEEEKGLYEDTSRIGTRDDWNVVLAAKELALRGHRLFKLSVRNHHDDIGPY